MRSDRERGSVLMLMPALILVVLVLGAVAIDSSRVLARRIELTDLAASAADDAATAGLDVEHFRATGEYVIDPDRAVLVVRTSLAASGVLDDLDRPPIVTVVDPVTVSVELTENVEHLFTPDAGTGGATVVTAAATATAIQR